MEQPTSKAVDAANHADNQNRFLDIEKKLDKLSIDTAELVEMWRDAGVFFKWMRRAGSAVVKLSKVAIGLGALYAAYKQWWSPK